MTTKVWLDVDAGVDDAQAIMMAIMRPELEVVGISCVAGNVACDLVVQNVNKVLRACQDETTPVYVGAARSLVSSRIDAGHYHGEDGLGNCAPEWKERARSVEQEHAVHALTRVSRELNGELVLIAIGPLTNVALAVRLDPTLPTRIKRFIVMGGSGRAQGNISLTAEFNFHCDPESAEICLEEFPTTELVTWEMTLEMALPWDKFEDMITGTSERSRFLRAITAHSVNRHSASAALEKSGGWVVCDACAVVLAVDPTVAVEVTREHMQVELAGKHTRGQVVMDWQQKEGLRRNVILLRKANLPRFYEILQSIAQ